MINLQTYQTQKYINLQNNQKIENVNDLITLFGEQIFDDFLDMMNNEYPNVDITLEDKQFVLGQIMQLFNQEGSKQIISQQREHTLKRICDLTFSPNSQCSIFQNSLKHYQKRKKYQINEKDNVIFHGGKLFIKFGNFYVLPNFYRLFPYKDNFFYMKMPKKLHFEIQEQDLIIDCFLFHVPCMYNYYFGYEDYAPYNHLLMDNKIINKNPSGLLRLLAGMSIIHNDYSEMFTTQDSLENLENIDQEMIKNILTNQNGIPSYGKFLTSENGEECLYQYFDSAVDEAVQSIQVEPTTKEFILETKYKQLIQNGDIAKLINQLPHYLDSAYKLLNYVNVVCYCAWINGESTYGTLTKLMTQRRVFAKLSQNEIMKMQQLISLDQNFYEAISRNNFTKHVHPNKVRELILFLTRGEQLYAKRQLNKLLDSTTIILFIIVLLVFSSIFFVYYSEQMSEIELERRLNLDKETMQNLRK